MPSLYIITGSNGAGKSTVGPDYLPEQIRMNNDVFDGDLLFMKKRSELYQSGIRSHKECKKLAFEWITEHFEALVNGAIAQNTNFVYEGHFTNDATWDIPKRFKEAGYGIHLIFLGVTSPGVSGQRVLARTKEGGHYVDPDTILSNFTGNLEKLDQYYEMFDTVQIMDTTEIEHQLLVVFEDNAPVFARSNGSLPEWFTTYLPQITDRIRDVEG